MADEEYEVWREVWRVTEWRDDCVYKTEFVDRRWVPMGLHKDPNDENLIYASCSMKNREGIGIRRK